MHLLVTDRLSCPRCGPSFGLILRADRLEERRVVTGALGCANCRDRYPIAEGVADLRPPPRSPLAEPGAPDPAAPRLDPAAVTAVAAALGVTDGWGQLLLVGGAARLAAALAAVLPAETEIVTATTEAPDSAVPRSVSRLVVGPDLPFFDRSVHGVALPGAEAGSHRLREAARVLASGHRVVVMDPPADIRGRLGGAGLTRFVEAERMAAGSR